MRRILTEEDGTIAVPVFVALIGLSMIVTLAMSYSNRQNAMVNNQSAVTDQVALSNAAYELKSYIEADPNGWAVMQGTGANPATALDLTDARGNPITYCDWSANDSFSSLQAGLLSSGLDQTLDTTCAQAASGDLQGDDLMEKVRMSDTFAGMESHQTANGTNSLGYANCGAEGFITKNERGDCEQATNSFTNFLNNNSNQFY